MPRSIFKKIKERVGDIDSEDGGLHPGSLWNLKKELFPKTKDPPTAMLDRATGNIVADHDKIKETTLLTNSKRLENKPIKNNLESIKVAKEMLCDKLLEVAAQNKTPPWKLKDL